MAEDGLVRRVPVRIFSELIGALKLRKSLQFLNGSVSMTNNVEATITLQMKG
jgi:hypothetical protein